jgi:hypothetical protein
LISCCQKVEVIAIENRRLKTVVDKIRDNLIKTTVFVAALSMAAKENATAVERE